MELAYLKLLIHAFEKDIEFYLSDVWGSKPRYCYEILLESVIYLEKTNPKRKNRSGSLIEWYCFYLKFTGKSIINVP